MQINMKSIVQIGLIFLAIMFVMKMMKKNRRREDFSDDNSKSEKKSFEDLNTEERVPINQKCIEEQGANFYSNMEPEEGLTKSYVELCKSQGKYVACLAKLFKRHIKCVNNKNMNDVNTPTDSAVNRVDDNLIKTAIERFNNY